jgi:hypothetical protein
VDESTLRYLARAPGTPTAGSRRRRRVSRPAARIQIVPQPEYPGHYFVKRITTGGTFRFRNRLLYLANAMVDQ